MPSFVPRSLAPVKQQETLAKREARLRHAISTSANADAIATSAEHVRESQLNILKARRELLRYKPESLEVTLQLENIAADEVVWRNLSIDDITRRYGF